MFDQNFGQIGNDYGAAPVDMATLTAVATGQANRGQSDPFAGFGGPNIGARAAARPAVQQPMTQQAVRTQVHQTPLAAQIRPPMQTIQQGPTGVTPPYVPVTPSFWWTDGAASLVGGGSAQSQGADAAAQNQATAGRSWWPIIIGLTAVAAVGGGIYWYTQRKGGKKRHSED